MAITKKTTHISEAQARLIEQFKGKANFLSVLAVFAQQIQDLEEAAFEVRDDTTLDSSVGVQLDGIGDIVGIARQGLNDADYRVRIGAQILLNISSATIEQLIALVAALGAPTNVTLLEFYPAGVEIYVDQVLVNGSAIGAVMVTAKAAGVSLDFTWYEDINPFKFGVSGQGFDQGKLGEIIGA